MQIYVCVKHVPDSAAKITIKDDNRIDESVTFLLNPHDENAVEEAVRLKAQIKDSEVIAVTLGRQCALSTLRSALAMGADRAILIKTDDRPDSVITGKALHQAILQDGKADIIFTGKESIDSEGMQTMFRLAAALDVSVANNVSAFSMGQEKITVKYETETGTTAVVVMALPCVVGVGKGLNKPRYPTLPNIIKARKKVIKQIDLNDLKINASAAKMEVLALRPAVEARRAKGKDLLPRIAAALDAPLVMDCIHVNLVERTVEKPRFSGKIIATIKVNGTHFLFGIRPNAIEAMPTPCDADTIVFQTEVTSKRLVVEALEQGASRGVELSEAAIVISGGRAMANSENFDILKQPAAVMGAVMGASRSAVDAGWVPHAMQVGQTGTTVSPKVYIACGISGSVQHFAGIKTAGFIIAVNTDPNASIITNCDYYAIADLFEIMPLLTHRLKAALERS